MNLQNPILLFLVLGGFWLTWGVQIKTPKTHSSSVNLITELSWLEWEEGVGDFELLGVVGMDSMGREQSQFQWGLRSISSSQGRPFRWFPVAPPSPLLPQNHSTSQRYNPSFIFCIFLIIFLSIVFFLYLFIFIRVFDFVLLFDVIVIFTKLGWWSNHSKCQIYSSAVTNGDLGYGNSTVLWV